MSQNRTTQGVRHLMPTITGKQVTPAKNIGITVFGCEKDEAELFRALSPRFGITPAITSAPAAAWNSIPALGNQCVSVDHKTKIPASALAALRAAGVRYISTRSIGCDHIDAGAAAKLGITVESAAYPPDGVADYTLMLLLMCIRGAKTTVTNAQSLNFSLNAARGKELRDLTVGVVGTGRIGKAVIDRLRGFGCRVLACSRNRAEHSVPLPQLLRESDIVTLHVPLNANTYHMIGQEALSLMKPGAFLVNTARGALVDTGELIHALQNGRLGGAALDVLEGEEDCFYTDCSGKSISNPFLPQLSGMPHVIITPHTAYYTGRALYSTVEQTILNCLNFERSGHGA